jgi:Holliday junction resolvase-like predicted endonuclease
MFKPSPRQKSKLNRKLYQKGHYWEKEAQKLLEWRYRDYILFIIKAPYAYPFDILIFSSEPYYNIWLIEVKYRYDTNVISIQKKKLKRIKEFISRFRKVHFRFIVVAFYQSKYNYIIKDMTEFLSKNRYPSRIVIPINSNSENSQN